MRPYLGLKGRKKIGDIVSSKVEFWTSKREIVTLVERAGTRSREVLALAAIVAFLLSYRSWALLL